MRARLSTRVSVCGPISTIRCPRAKGTHLAGSGPGAFFPGLSGRAVVAMDGDYRKKAGKRERRPLGGPDTAVSTDEKDYGTNIEQAQWI